MSIVTLTNRQLEVLTGLNRPGTSGRDVNRQLNAASKQRREESDRAHAEYMRQLSEIGRASAQFARARGFRGLRSAAAKPAARPASTPRPTSTTRTAPTAIVTKPATGSHWLDTPQTLESETYAQRNAGGPLRRSTARNEFELYRERNEAHFGGGR